MKKKVMLGMSGGVDSSVAAMLLVEAGYDVTGVTLRLRPDRLMEGSMAGGCCPLDDVDDARRVAYQLGIEHLVFNFTDIFEKQVIDYFAEEYLAGRTPNPCIACNRHVKFHAMLRRATELGFDYVATGHYAKIRRNEAGRWLLERADAAKDQSYVLYSMTQYQLEHTLFPLADYEKEQVRALARKKDFWWLISQTARKFALCRIRITPGLLSAIPGKRFRQGTLWMKPVSCWENTEGLPTTPLDSGKGWGSPLESLAMSPGLTLRRIRWCWAGKAASTGIP